jgi:pimeloyl-ACP methyl ester carboxylesterase
MRSGAAAVLGLLGGVLCACRTAAPPAEPATPSLAVDEAAIGALPGYRSEMVNAPVFGGQVFVMEVGAPEAPAVVLVHGLGENGARDWYSVLPSLAANYHVVTFDLPGFGRSTHANELYSPARYVEFMHALLGPRLPGGWNLVGHSMGGAIALGYAAKYPADVKRLLLVDVAGVLHRKAYVNFAVSAGLDNLLGVLAEPAKKVVSVVEESANASVPPILSGTPDPSVILQHEFLRSTLLGTSTKIAALATILENFAPAIAGVKAPSWILWGGRDAIASLRTGQILQARLPQARLQVLENAGHDPMASDPGAVARFLLGALGTAVQASAGPPAAFPKLPERKGRCNREGGTRFTGDYADIEITGCTEVTLKDVRTGALRISNSNVSAQGVHVVAQEVALDVKGSRVDVTASDFTGKVGLAVENSDLDLAGVTLRGQRAAVHIGSSTKLIISVSRVESPINSRYLHGVYELDVGAEL